MSVSIEKEFIQGKLEDSLIQRISTAKIDLERSKSNNQDDEEPQNRLNNKRRENSDDLSNIEDIANKISMYILST